MKKKWLLASGVALTIVLLALALSGCAATGAGSQSPGILGVNLMQQQQGTWIDGEGKVSAVPDVAVITLGVSAQTTTVADAQSQASAAMDKVMAALTANGVVKKDIRTQSYNVQQVTRYDDKTQKETVIGYKVSNMVVAKIRMVDKAGSVIDAVAAAGGDLTRINGISFTIDDPTSYFKDARDKAMADAKAKADQVAKLAGVTLGKPTYISESSYVPAPRSPMAAPKLAMADSASSTPISSGELDITVNVQVTYAIQ